MEYHLPNEEESSSSDSSSDEEEQKQAHQEYAKKKKATNAGIIIPELAELGETKAALEERRRALMTAARRLGIMDDFELAALSGLQSGDIRKMTWGLQPGLL